VGSGGGYKMNKHLDSRTPKVEPKAYAKRPAGVAGIGSFYGDHVTNKGSSTGFKGEKLDGGRGYSPPVGPTNNVAAVGVGGGRKIYASGSQGQQGQAAPGNPPAVPSEHIIESFGPTYKTPRSWP
jgi:hypothetical protein